MPRVVTGCGFEYRLHERGGLTVAVIRLPAGADLTPAYADFPHSLCPCAHWVYVMEGRLRMHSLSGPTDYGAGEVFAVDAGHAPQALEDCEYVELSRTADMAGVVKRLTGLRTGSGRDDGWPRDESAPLARARAALRRSADRRADPGSHP